MSRIALLLPDLEVGGAQRVMLMLSREFIALGHSVDLLVILKQGPLLDEIPQGVQLTGLIDADQHLSPVRVALSASLRLTAWLRRNRPAVLLSSVTGANLVALMVGKLILRNIHVVIREAGSPASIRSRIRKWIMCKLYPLADAVVALSPAMAEQLSRDVGVTEKKVHCIPNPVDVDFVLGKSHEPLSHPMLDEWQGRVLVAVGRLIPEKDYATLIRSIAMLSDSTNCRLFIVGEGEERALLELLIRHLALESRVVLVGFDANPWRWLARADVYVLSSRSEGHPNTLLEALALGVPCVVTEYDDSVCELAKRYGFLFGSVGCAGQFASIVDTVLVQDEAKLQLATLDSVSSVARRYLSICIPPSSSGRPKKYVAS